VSSGDGSAHYHERVTVPFSYWAIALFFGLTFVTAVTFMLGEAILVFSTLATAGLIAWTLIAWGSQTITVESLGVRVGRSLLEWRYVGQVAPVDRQQRQRIVSREDVHLALRPYISEAVVIGVADEADPHLCWLVSTRDPEGMVRAIQANRGSGAHQQAGESALDSGG
jgi:hypothetical protein